MLPPPLWLQAQRSPSAAAAADRRAEEDLQRGQLQLKGPLPTSRSAPNISRPAPSTLQLPPPQQGAIVDPEADDGDWFGQLMEEVAALRQGSGTALQSGTATGLQQPMNQQLLQQHYSAPQQQYSVPQQQQQQYIAQQQQQQQQYSAPQRQQQQQQYSAPQQQLYQQGLGPPCETGSGLDYLWQGAAEGCGALRTAGGMMPSAAHLLPGRSRLPRCPEGSVEWQPQGQGTSLGSIPPPPAI